MSPRRPDLLRAVRLALVRARLALRVWAGYVRVRRGLATTALPSLVAELARPPSHDEQLHPAVLSRAVDRSLHLGPLRPRCLTTSLVLYALLREQGDEAALVIGLPDAARDKNAHAWVELEGHDVGPPPGKGSHVEIARYPRAAADPHAAS